MIIQLSSVYLDDELYIICLCFKRMIDKALAGLNPLQNQGQSYYFQLYPLSLTIIGESSTVPAPGTTYRFVIFKGQQKFDETKLPIEANYKNINGVNLMVMPKCPINFYTPTFNKNRKTEFQFKMFQYEENEEYFIAEYNIDIQPYITEYKNSRTMRFEHKNNFSDDYELQFEIYIEKSRFALEKVVKDYKHERSLKSPLRQRKQSSPSKQGRKISPSKKNLTNEQPVKQERKQVSNQSSKIQRQEITQLSQSRNKKVEELQNSLKGDSKKVSVRNSRNNPSVIEPQREVQPENSKQTKEVQVLEPETFEKKQESKIQQKSVKNYSQKAASETSSVNKVPVITTRFKPLAKEDTPNQIKMNQSQRLGQNATQNGQKEVQTTKKQTGNTKQKILMALFLIVSFFLMYQSMHPNRRV